ncbi:cold shock domain-containing protein 4-like [Spinacia oleracea]|uniref:Cold shock domain-containing protein 4-like n=1 Tax=Spinacia oleracea TaxID=3562 RepID=A0ABM3QVT2_SPIOL|nr:cold shock domain-containing protein 4-like [Spinacia oleracea]
MPDPTQWLSFDLPIILPPPMKRASGRPPNLRKRGKHDPKRGKRNSTVRCGKCKEVGHNARTCRGGATAKQKKAAAAAAAGGGGAFGSAGAAGAAGSGVAGSQQGGDQGASSSQQQRNASSKGKRKLT